MLQFALKRRSVVSLASFGPVLLPAPGVPVSLLSLLPPSQFARLCRCVLLRCYGSLS